VSLCPQQLVVVVVVVVGSQGSSLLGRQFLDCPFHFFDFQYTCAITHLQLLSIAFSPFATLRCIPEWLHLTLTTLANFPCFGGLDSVPG
jgi:hypothetical protein